MKNVKTILSIFLTVALLLGCVPCAIVSAEDSGEVIIFEARPESFAVGSDVTATVQSGNWANTNYPVTVQQDEDGFYYHNLIQPNNPGTSTMYNNFNHRIWFKSGLDSGSLAWLDASDDGNAVRSATAGLVTLHYRYKINSADKTGNIGGANRSFGFGTAYATGKATSAQLYNAEYETVVADPLNTWIDVTVPNLTLQQFYSGYVMFGIRITTPYWLSDISVDIRDIKLTVNESDRSTIDAAFAASGSTRTLNSLVLDLIKSTSPGHPIYAVSSNLGSEGDDISLSWNDLHACSEGRVTVGEDDDGKYIIAHCTTDSLSNHRPYFFGGFNSDQLVWMADDRTMAALDGFVTVNYDYMISKSFSGSTSVAFDMGTANAGQEYKNWSGYQTKIAMGDSASASFDTWHSGQYTPTGWKNFRSGYIGFSVNFGTAVAGGWVEIAVRNIRFCVYEQQKDDLNAALAAAGSIWTYDSLISTFATADANANASYYKVWTTNMEEQYNKETIDVAEIKPNASVNVGHTWRGNIEVTDDEEGYYYESTLSFNAGEHGGDMAGNIVQGSYSNNSVGYGWIESTSVFNAIQPYLYYTFEYRILNGANLPSMDLYLTLANDYNYNIGQIDVIRLKNTGDWVKQTTPKKFVGTNSSSWYNGYFHYNIYSTSEFPQCTFLLDFRNFSFVLREQDRDYINAALHAAGSKLTFDQLLSNDPDYKAVDTVWYANPDRVAAQTGSNNMLDDTVSTQLSAGNATRITDDGSYYHVSMDVSGNGGSQYRAVLKSGINSMTDRFGWMTSESFLDRLGQNLYIAFDYRLGFDTPDNTTMYLSASGASNAQSTILAAVAPKKPGEWESYYGEVATADFGGAWNTGNLDVTLYNTTGFENGMTVSVDLRNVRLLIKHTDVAAINHNFLKSLFGNSIANCFADHTYDYYREQGSTTWYIDVYNYLKSALPSVKWDLNDDSVVDVIDLVRAKKYVAGDYTLPEFIALRADYDKSHAVNADDLSQMKLDILLKSKKVYNDALKVELVTDHPGVAGYDAAYQLKVIDASTGEAINSGCNVSVNNSAVSVSGLNLTIPSAVRTSGNEVTATVTYGKKSGRYTFNFQKFSSTATFRDDFNTFNANNWNGQLSDYVGIENGNLKLTCDANGNSGQVESTGKFYQAYGSFSARIKMPASGVLSNAAFWLRSNSSAGYGAYVPDEMNPAQQGGEIDIVEYYATWGDRWSSTVHFNGWNALHRQSGDDGLPGSSLPGTYHVYSAVWTPDAIYSYLDGVLCRVYDGAALTDESQPMDIVIGNIGKTANDEWGGIYNPSKFPGYMYIDWVEVYALAD